MNYDIKDGKIEVSKYELVKSIIHCLEVTADSFGYTDNKYTIDLENEKIIFRKKGFIFQRTVGTYDFDEFLEGFFSRNYK